MNEFLKQFIAVIAYSALSFFLSFGLGGQAILFFVLIAFIHSVLLLVRVITIAVKHQQNLGTNFLVFLFVFAVFLIGAALTLYFIGEAMSSVF
jgi:uncharacterized membrane protein YhaH (DUF805 family)